MGGGWSGSLGERKRLTADDNPPTHPLASLGDVLFVLSSLHWCVPHYLLFPKIGEVVECMGIILFPIFLKKNLSLERSCGSHRVR